MNWLLGQSVYLNQYVQKSQNIEFQNIIIWIHSKCSATTGNKFKNITNLMLIAKKKEEESNPLVSKSQ